jgi:hypothetical protein
MKKLTIVKSILFTLTFAPQLSLACQPKGCVDPHPLPMPAPICHTKCTPYSPELNTAMNKIVQSSLGSEANSDLSIEETRYEGSVSEYKALVQTKENVSCSVGLISILSAAGQEFELSHTLDCD